jgi:hypothetical protein
MNNGDRFDPVLSSVSLLEAVLCADCEVISNSGGESCEVCGSRSLLSLGRILGGCIGPNRALLVDADTNHLRHSFTVMVNPNASTMLYRHCRNKSTKTNQK